MQLKICFGIVHCLKFPNGTNSAYLMVNIENTSTAKLKIFPRAKKREMVLTDVTTVKYDEWGEV